MCSISKKRKRRFGRSCGQRRTSMRNEKVRIKKIVSSLFDRSMVNVVDIANVFNYEFECASRECMFVMS
jgi:hypothetical protein